MGAERGQAVFRVSRWGRRVGSPRFFWIVCGAGIVLRVALAATRSSEWVWDERDYDEIARALLRGEGFSGRYGPTAFRPPGQPLLMALVYGVTGPNPLAVAVAQSLLLGVTTWAARGFARRVGLGPAGANLAALAVALHPGLAYATTTVFPTALTAAGVTVGLWFLVLAIEKDSAVRAGVGGAALGVAGAATTYFVLLVPAAVLFALGRRRVGVACAVAAVGLLPSVAWMGRNAVTLGGAVLSTQAGYNLALGAQELATPISGNEVEPALARIDAPDDELMRDRAYREVALGWIRAHPGRWAWLVMARAALVMDSAGHPRSESFRLSGAARALAAALSVGFVLGLWGLWKGRRKWVTWVALTPLVIVMVSGGATLMKPRFRFPCDPLITPFALVAFRRRRDRGRGTCVTSGPALISLLALTRARALAEEAPWGSRPPPTLPG